MLLGELAIINVLKINPTVTQIEIAKKTDNSERTASPIESGKFL